MLNMIQYDVKTDNRGTIDKECGPLAIKINLFCAID